MLFSKGHIEKGNQHELLEAYTRSAKGVRLDELVGYFRNKQEDMAIRLLMSKPIILVNGPCSKRKSMDEVTFQTPRHFLDLCMKRGLSTGLQGLIPSNADLQGKALLIQPHRFRQILYDSHLGVKEKGVMRGRTMYFGEFGEEDVYLLVRSRVRSSMPKDIKSSGMQRAHHNSLVAFIASCMVEANFPGVTCVRRRPVLTEPSSLKELMTLTNIL